MNRLLGALLIAGAFAMPAAAENAPRVTDTEIKIGQTMPYTGPGARLALPGKAELAYMQMINDRGGVNGRKILASMTASCPGAPAMRRAS